MATTEHFDEWWEAFDTCRERNCPMRVGVGSGGGEWKIFPSGTAQPLNESARLIDANESVNAPGGPFGSPEEGGFK